MTSPSRNGGPARSDDDDVDENDAAAFALIEDILEDSSHPEEEVVFDDDILCLGDVDERRQDDGQGDHHHTGATSAVPCTTSPNQSSASSSVPATVNVGKSKSPPPSLTKSVASGAFSPGLTVTSRLSIDDEDEEPGDDPTNPSSLEEGDSSSFHSGSPPTPRKLDFANVGGDDARVDGGRNLQRHEPGDEGWSLPSSSTASIQKHVQRKQREQGTVPSRGGTRNATATIPTPRSGACSRSVCRVIVGVLLGLGLVATACLIVHDPTLPARTATFFQVMPFAEEYKVRMEAAEGELWTAHQEAARLQAEVRTAAARADKERLQAQMAIAERTKEYQEEIETLQSNLQTMQGVASMLRQDIEGLTKSKEAAESKVQEQLGQINDLIQRFNSESANRRAVELEKENALALVKEQGQQIQDLLVLLEEAEVKRKQEELARQEAEWQLVDGMHQKQPHEEAETMTMGDVAENGGKEKLRLIQEQERIEDLRRWEEELAESREKEERRIMEELMRVRIEKYDELNLELERQEEVQSRHMLEELMLARKELEASLTQELEHRRSEEERRIMDELQNLRAEKEAVILQELYASKEKKVEGNSIQEQSTNAMHGLRERVLVASGNLAVVKVKSTESVLLQGAWKKGERIAPKVLIKMKDAVPHITRNSKVYFSKLADLGSRGIRYCGEATKRKKESLLTSVTFMEVANQVRTAAGQIERQLVVASSKMSRMPLKSAEAALLKGALDEGGASWPKGFGKVASVQILAKTKGRLEHLRKQSASGLRWCSTSTKTRFKSLVRDSKKVAENTRGTANQLAAYGMGSLVQGKEAILNINTRTRVAVGSFSTAAIRTWTQVGKNAVENITKKGTQLGKNAVEKITKFSN